MFLNIKPLNIHSIFCKINYGVYLHTYTPMYINLKVHVKRQNFVYLNTLKLIFSENCERYTVFISVKKVSQKKFFINFAALKLVKIYFVHNKIIIISCWCRAKLVRRVANIHCPCPEHILLFYM